MKLKTAAFLSLTSPFISQFSVKNCRKKKGRDFIYVKMTCPELEIKTLCMKTWSSNFIIHIYSTLTRKNTMVRLNHNSTP